MVGSAGYWVACVVPGFERNSSPPRASVFPIVLTQWTHNSPEGELYALVTHNDACPGHIIKEIERVIAVNFA